MFNVRSDSFIIHMHIEFPKCRYHIKLSILSCIIILKKAIAVNYDDKVKKLMALHEPLIDAANVSISVKINLIYEC